VPALASVLLASSVGLLVKSTYKSPLPLKEGLIAVDGSPPPNSIAAMKAEADAVVLGTYRGEQRSVNHPNRAQHIPPPPWGFDPPRDLPIPTSIHVFEIREVIKPHVMLRNRHHLKLQLIGGVEQLSNRIVRSYVAGRRELVPGRRYIVFCRIVRSRWIPAFGHDGGSMSIYDVSGGRDAVSLTSPRF
jgi:hypothetical protein